MKWLKRILYGLFTFILGVILIYNLYNIISLRVLKKDLTTVNGYGILEVISGSMQPTINVGDIVVINTKDKDIKEEDIITFYDENKAFVTHRVVEINDEGIITKGDNNDSLDNPINKEVIVGKYVFKLTKAGILLAAVKSPITLVMIFIIGLLLCILFSTDKNGNPILTEEEKDFEAFRKYKEGLITKKELDKITSKKKTSSKKNTTTKKEESKKGAKKAVEKKTTTKKGTTKKTTTKKSATKKTTPKKSTTKKGLENKVTPKKKVTNKNEIVKKTTSKKTTKKK